MTPSTTRGVVYMGTWSVHGWRVQIVVPSGCKVNLWVNTASTGQSWSVSNSLSSTCGWTGGKLRGLRGRGAAVRAAWRSSSVRSCNAYSSILVGIVHLPGVLRMFTPGGSAVVLLTLCLAGAAPTAKRYGLYPTPGTVLLSGCFGKYCNIIFRYVSPCSCNKVLNICDVSWRASDPPPTVDARLVRASARTAYARHLRRRCLSV